MNIIYQNIALVVKRGGAKLSLEIVQEEEDVA